VPAKPESRSPRRMNRVCRFEGFEVNFASWELRKGGVRVRLQRKPFQILRALLGRPGEVVTREELASELWPDLHVEFERSLNTAVNVLRQALGDSSKACRFIETCSGLGYRFIGAVEELAATVEDRVEAIPRIVSVAQADYRKGVFFYGKMTAESLARAAAYFESATQSDPRFAAPYAGLADIQNLLAAWSFVATPSAARKAYAYAEAALAVDAGLAEAHTALATAARLLRHPAPDVEHRYRTALELDDACVRTHMWYGDFLCASGRFTEAIEELREAQQLDPLSLVVNFRLAWVLYAARDFRSALTESWNTLMLEPGFAPAQYTLGLAHQQLGQFDEAFTEFENARRCSGDHPATVASQGYALAVSGRKQEAVAALTELDDAARERYVSPYWRALVRTGLGEYEAARGLLQDTAKSGDILADWSAVDPRFDALRFTPA
jgi:DNA-binding winged helix-turn-helix (wHTH) protein/tetratricopeptide (TPR) repeat protein